MTETNDLKLGEPGEERAWRALVEAGLKGASWDTLVARIAGGILIEPLYREGDFPTAADISGFPGAAPFVRGVRESGAWSIRQSFTHPDPLRTNRDILADLAGGVSSIELVIDPHGRNGVAVRDAADLDLALADVIPEAAPVALDAPGAGLWAAELLAAKLKGASGAGVAFNVDPIGAALRTGVLESDEIANAAHFALRMRDTMPRATTLRADARPVHEAGASPAQEIGAALASGIAYVQAMMAAGLTAANANASLLFTLSVGPDVLVEAAKLRALRLAWARVMEAYGAPPEACAGAIHAVTSRRMMTRYDAWTNILRVTTAAFAAAIGGADAITTLPLTDALGLPTPFARRLARNTQHVLMEECRLGHVADPAGGAWFVEKLTRELGEAGWRAMQATQLAGGVDNPQARQALVVEIGEERSEQAQLYARRRQTITGITDFPLPGAQMPETEQAVFVSKKTAAPPRREAQSEALQPMRWAAPFETLRDAGEAARAGVFFANIGKLSEFAPSANFARNFLAAGGVGAIGPETAYDTVEALIDAFRRSGAKVALISSSDPDPTPNCARALKHAGALWVMVAGKPKDEALLREAGVDQFLVAGEDALLALAAVHRALGLGP